MREKNEKQPNPITRFWQGLSAGTRRSLWLAFVAAVVVGGLTLFVTSNGERKQRGRVDRSDISREIFTRTDPNDLNLHGLAAKVQALQKENSELKGSLEDLKHQTKTSPEDQAKEVARMKALQEKAIEQAMESFEKKYAKKIELLEKNTNKPLQSVPHTAPVVQAPQTFDASSLQSGQGTNSGNPALSAADVDWQVKGPSQPVTVSENKGGNGGTKKKSMKMRQIVDEEAQAAAEANAKAKIAKKEKEQSPEVFIPAGSIFSGTLITGLDAPTGNASKKSPFPSLLRVKKEAILPNHYRADVRECFIVASGYGDLSSERAYLRGETISCVRSDGGVLEAPIDMYAVGEDGKAGIRGVLDTKQGQFLAKALAAGFLESVSSVFNTSAVPTISTTASDTTPFQQVFSGDAAQSAGIKGFGSAMDRLAQVYIDMSQQVFPIIQVDAGRQVDFVMTRGTSLKLR